MTCPKCGSFVQDYPFMRVNEKGIKGIFWCEPCVQKYEPELYKNEIEDGGEVMKDLKNIFYKQTNNNE